MAKAIEPDLSEFYQLATRSKKPPCKVWLALEALKGDQAQQATMRAALDTPGIPNGAIEEWARRRSLTISSSALTAHRTRRNCTCHDQS